jgi:predicted metalloprotease with PDZ domain
VCVRLLRIEGSDLNFFEFDCDLTWAAFFLDPSGQRVLGRFGGRDAKDADARNSLTGLRYAMQAVLERLPALTAEAVPPQQEPLLIEKISTRHGIKGCVHCHQAKELLRAEAKQTKTWDPDSRWVYPLPENIGLTLDRDRGDRIAKVAPDSLAARAGIAAGDVLQRLAGRTVLSFADAQYALHKAPAAGQIDVRWSHAGATKTATLELPAGWKKTNLTWRPSLLDILPTMRAYGDELSAAEKVKLGLEPTRLAFRQETQVPKALQAAGLRAGDVISGVDGLKLHLDVDGFLGYVRRNYLVGDRVVLNVYRDGRPLDVALTLE